MPPRRGFALIVALALMAFVVLLIISLSTMVVVETQLSTTRGELRTAQQNALLGMNIALGKLQSAAGPDQRVTGTAGLIDGMGEPLHQHWTGVWDVSGRDSHAPFAEPALTGWLVSGVDTGGNPLTPGSDVQDPVFLLGEGSVDDPDQRVQVGKVEIEGHDTGSATGHYAYWVSDEGVKAKVNLSDPHRDAPSGDSAQKRYSLLTAQRYGIESISTDAESGAQNTVGESLYPLDNTSSNAWVRLLSLEQMGIIDSSLDTTLERRYHDLTTHSWGLLTNTANGGLKKDLSLAFEMGLTDFNNDADFSGYESVRNLSAHQVNYLFKFDDFNAPLPAAANPMVRGPTWHLLRNYYRLYKPSDPDSSYKPLHPGGVQSTGSQYKIVARPNYPLIPNHQSLQDGYYHTSSDPVVRPYFTAGGGDIDLARETDMPINPVVLRQQLFMSLLAETVSPPDPDAGTEGTYRLKLKIAPVITLWNPYNVQLEFESLVVKLNELKIKSKISADGDEVASLSEMLADSVIELDISSVSGGAITLAPGQMAIYAMDNNITYASNDVFSPCYSYTGSIASLPGVVFTNLGAGNQPLEVSGSAFLELSIESTSWMQGVVMLQRGSGGDLREVQGSRLEIDGSITRAPEVALSVLVANGLIGANTALPIASLDISLKPTYPSDGVPVQFLANYNPRATMARRSTGDSGKANWGEDTQNPGNWAFTAKEETSANSTSLPSSASWGDTFEYGSYNRVVLFDIPTTPLQSLAQLQHVNNVTHYAQQPASPIGNSSASPFIGRTALSRTLTYSSGNYTQVDWSYLSNEALWDAYYFSTLSPRADLGLSDGEWNEIVTGFADGTYELANSRIQLMPGTSTEDFAALVLGNAGGTAIDADAYDRVGSELIVNGAFNVNSTSVEAWKALLSSTNGLEVLYDGNKTDTANGSAFSRLSMPADTAGAEWMGYRELSEAEVQELAEAIVDEVKLRGPFVSLSDFVNRRLADDDTGLKGALQAAIDATDINDDFNETVTSVPNITFDAHAVGATAAGATGYLTQADVLQTIGPVLSARSDTFVIRAYGDSVNPVTGEKVHAWCEAVVQRVPEYVDTSDAATASPGTLSATNDRFGRRFEIISFRWLGDDQI